MVQDSTNSVFNAIKDKVFFSRHSNVMVEVVEKLPEKGEAGKAYFDGMTLLDCVEDIEDDIQQVCCITKKGKKVILEDYYQKNGAYDKDNTCFIKALNDLMTCDEYEQYGVASKLKYDKTKTILKSCDAGIVDLLIPQGITAIGQGALNASALTLRSVHIPEGVTIIGNNAFRYCSKLQTVVLPNTLTVIEKRAFYNCLQLSEITLPDSLIEIGEFAFLGCCMTNLRIPESVTKIERNAFRWTKLEVVYIKNPQLLSDAGLDAKVNIITDY